MPDVLKPTVLPHAQEAACDVVQIHPDRVTDALLGMPDGATVERMAEVFKALSDPTRLHILLALADRELCVCDLCAVVGLSQSAVSHQLRLLRQLRMVRSRRDGRLVYYHLDDHHVQAMCAQTRAHLAEPHSRAE